MFWINVLLMFVLLVGFPVLGLQFLGSYTHHGEKVEVIDSFFQDAPVDAKPLWYLAKSLELLSTADVAYFAKDWEKYRGCRIENTCAIEYGIDVIEDYRE